LDRHDDSGSCLLALFAAIAMAANLLGHPARDYAVNYPPDLTVQAGVQLKPPAQPHLLGQAQLVGL
jgi:hypothetical protein